jgi:hypothetical protein
MSFPPPSGPVVITASNPLEAFITSFNTNAYFIGFMMILLNLGGRHLVGTISVEQDKLFQSVWARRFLVFVVIFIATRNIFSAFWLSIAVVIILQFLTNETNPLYLFGDPVKVKPPPPQPVGLSQEEAEIYKRLHDRVTKEREKGGEESVVEDNSDSFINSYINTMKTIQGSNG